MKSLYFDVSVARILATKGLGRFLPAVFRKPKRPCERRSRLPPMSCVITTNSAFFVWTWDERRRRAQFCSTRALFRSGLGSISLG